MSARPADLAVRLDLRLVPPAVAAWAAALLVVHDPRLVARVVAVPAALLVLGVLAAVAAAVRHACGAPAAAGRPPPASSVTAALALALATASTVLVAGAAAVAARTPELLTAAVGHDVEVRGRVATAPARFGDTTRWRLTTSAVHVDGTWWRLAVPLEVVAPQGAPAGTAVHVRGSLRAGGRGGLLRLRTEAAPVVTAPPGAVAARAAAVRDAARTVAAPLPPDVRGLLPAVTVGDTSDVPDDLADAMRTAGLAHVTAVSGAHFAILGTLVLAATAAVRVPRPARVAAVAAAGAGLLLVVGPEPSVVRAAVMGAVGLLGLLAGRRAAGPAALATAVVVLLVVDPWLAVEAGFALSVAATAGLVVLGAPLVDRWSRRCGREPAALLAAPVAAQVGCLPVALALWPTLGPWGVVANVVVAPAVAPATVLGLGAALLAGAWPAGAGVLASTAGAALWWVARVARTTALLPGASVAWWPGVGGVLAATLVALGVAGLVLHRPRGTTDRRCDGPDGGP